MTRLSDSSHAHFSMQYFTEYDYKMEKIETKKKQTNKHARKISNMIFKIKKKRKLHLPFRFFSSFNQFLDKFQKCTK